MEITDKAMKEKVEALKASVQEEHPPHFLVIANLWAIGNSEEQIAAMTGLVVFDVKHILGLDWVKAQAEEIQRRMIGHDPSRGFQMMLPDAVLTTGEIMRNKAEKGNTRLMAVNTILDRTIGKPNQTVEIGASTLRSLIDALDKEREARSTATIEAKSERLDTLEPAIDAEAKWLEENL